MKNTAEYIKELKAGNRRTLAKIITLVESVRPDDTQKAREIIDAVMPNTGKSIRIGVTGVPGVGKSSFIESFGLYLTKNNHKVAALAIDPSSIRTGGSILADKTRMDKLCLEKNAFIRPSPSSGALGGVARKTKEAMLICEAAGFDVIIVETVGVGQSETTAASMVDFFLVLMLAGAGDELQGIKKGILEIADAIVINKSDGDNIKNADIARKEYQNALSLLHHESPLWNPPVLTCSALNSEGIEKIWQTITEYKKIVSASGEFDKKRRKQAIDWMRFLITEEIKERFYNNKKVKEMLPELTLKVEQGLISPSGSVDKLMRETTG
ncbi:MAG: methylmalonyl Co-A mutase-associated GTPase MeaB [Deltaproteobacteria bacterium]|nr:methylmalonyl Co-A mutase-associated GTPase MeaB [Deltaproteobacteria bacterium]